MAQNETHNPAFREVMVKGCYLSYGIANSRGSGHSPPCKV